MESTTRRQLVDKSLLPNEGFNRKFSLPLEAILKGRKLLVTND